MNFKILIPKNYIEPLIKKSIGERNAICSLLILKSINKGGCHAMEDSRKRGLKKEVLRLNEKERTLIAEVQNCTTKTIGNHVEAWLSMGLAEVKNNNLVVASYDKIAEYLELSYASPSKYMVTPTHRKLGYVIEKIAIENEQQRRKSAFKHNIEKVPFLKQDLMRIVGEVKNLSSDALWHKQLRTFENGTYDQDNYLLFQHRADFNPNYDFLKEMFGYESRGGVAFMKRRLYRAGLIRFAKRSIDLPSEQYTSVLKRKKSTAAKYGRIFFDMQTRTLKLFICDQIEPLNHNFEVKKEDVRKFEDLIKAVA